MRSAVTAWRITLFKRNHATHGLHSGRAGCGAIWLMFRFIVTRNRESIKKFFSHIIHISQLICTFAAATQIVACISRNSSVGRAFHS